MFMSSPIAIFASPHDRAIVTDPAIRYRPDKIAGRRYHIPVTAPRPEATPAQAKNEM